MNISNSRDKISSLKELNKLSTAIASEKSLAKLWDTPEEDEAWTDL
jgi:hypothetical protein